MFVKKIKTTAAKAYEEFRNTELLETSMCLGKNGQVKEETIPEARGDGN